MSTTAELEIVEIEPGQKLDATVPALRDAGWSDELKYHGDSESYIFSFAPNFRSFYAYRGQGGTNYTYMNTKRIQGSKYKVGLGILLR